MTYITMSQTATANDSRTLSWHLVGQKAKASILTPFDFTSFSFVSNAMVEGTPHYINKCKCQVIVERYNALQVFGPVALIIVADDEKEAIEIANDSKFGPGASIWTQNLEKAEELSSMVESGMVTVNNVMISETLLFFLVV